MRLLSSFVGATLAAVLFPAAVLAQEPEQPVGAEQPAQPEGDAAQPAEGVEAAEAPPLLIPFAGTESETHRGVLVTVDYWVPLPEQWDLTQPARIEVHYSHSPVLIERLSSLTGAVNDNAVGSILLNLKDAARGVIAWDVPPEYLKLGEGNKITLTAKMRSDLELCDDVHSPALWLTIHGESRLRIRYREKPITPDLSRFPDSFLRPELFWSDDPKERVHATIVVPENPSAEVLNGIGVIAARMGVSSRFPRGALQVVQVDALDPAVTQQLAQHNLIVVGQLPFARQFVRGEVDDERGVPEAMQAGGEGFGHLLEWRNPWNTGRRMLVVTGSDDAALSKAVTALSLPHLSKEWAPQNEDDPPKYYATYDSKPEIPASVANERSGTYTISLADLGVTDMTFRGKFTHVTNFSFPNPFVGGIKHPAWMRFYISHSELLVPQTSSLMVKIGGEPVRSIRLTPRTARWLEADVLVPERFLNERNLQTTLEFFLDIGDPDCHYNYPEMSWATVYNTSFVAYPLTGEPTTSLRSYPWVVTKEPNLNGLTFVVADDPTDASLSAVANVAAYLGKQLPRKTDHRGDLAAQWVHPWVRPAGALDGANLKEQDLIVVGDYQAVRANGQIAASIPEMLFADTSSSEPRTYTAGAYRAESGWIYLGKSPWAERRNLLVVTGEKGAPAIEQAAEYLWVQRKVERLSGSAVLIGPNGSLQVVQPAAGEQEEAQTAKVAPEGPRVPEQPLETLAESEAGEVPPTTGLAAAPAEGGDATSKRVVYLMFVLLGLLLVVLVVFRIRDSMRSDAR